MDIIRPPHLSRWPARVCAVRWTTVVSTRRRQSREAVWWYNRRTAWPAGTTQDRNLPSSTVERMVWWGMPPCEAFTEITGTFSTSYGSSVRFYATSCDSVAHWTSTLLRVTTEETIRILDDPRRLWTTTASPSVAVFWTEQLLGRGKAPTTADIGASVLHRLFDDNQFSVKIVEIGLYTFIHRLAFQNVLQYRTSDSKRFIYNTMIWRHCVNIWWTSVQWFQGESCTPLVDQPFGYVRFTTNPCGVSTECSAAITTQVCFTCTLEGVIAMPHGLHARLCHAFLVFWMMMLVMMPFSLLHFAGFYSLGTYVPSE